MRAASIRVRLKGTGTYLPTGDAAPVPATANAALGPTPSSAHHGASLGRRLGGWRPTAAGPNSIVSADGPETVRRARDLVRNNLHTRRAKSLYRAHIIGTGIKPRSLCSNKEVREAIHKLWALWAPYADADGAYGIYGLQGAAVDELTEGGEGFVRMRPRRLDDGLPVPLQLQLIPTEQVPVHHTTSYGTNRVVQGIERDAVGRRVAYWMYRQHPGDVALGQPGDTWTLSRVDAADVAHLRLTAAGQLRGLPWLTVALPTLKQLGDWKDAALLRKQLIAALVAFVRRPIAGDVGMEEMRELWNDIKEGEFSEMLASLEPGTVQYLDPGEDIQFTDWKETAGQDEVFERSQLRSVAAGLDLIYEELSGDWTGGVSDRTFRAASNTMKRVMRQYQYELVGHQLMQPVYRRWIDVAVASGALTVPAGISDADLKNVEWQPEAWEYINPKQEIEATALAIKAGLISREAAVARSGDDVEVTDAQRAADLEREERLNLILTTTASASADPTAEDVQP